MEPKTTLTNNWLRAERHGSLTPRLENSLASRRLQPFRFYQSGTRIDHPQRRLPGSDSRYEYLARQG